MKYIEQAIILGLLIYIIILLSEKCSNKPIPVNDNIAYKRGVDSVAKMAEIRLDSIQEIEKELEVEIHFARIKKTELEKQLNASQLKAARLASGVIKARRDNDTTSYILNCDSASEHIAFLNDMIDAIEQVNDQVIDMNDSLVAANNVSIKEQALLTGYIRNAFNAVSDKYDSLFEKQAKLHRRAKRKISVTMGVGPGIGPDLKVRPVGAIIIGYRLY